MQHLTFSWIDYLVFSTLLGISLVIGVYFGFFSKQDTTNEYLYGGKTMGFLPVAVSLLSSSLSGITFLGAPTEIYLYGTAYLNNAITAVLNAFITIYVFLPVLFKLQLSCTNEYLELRFSKSVRALMSLAYIIGILLISSVIIYVPALAFSQVTNYSVHAITPVLTIICITYTSMGGVKAVIWTDTFQFIFTLIGLFSILGVGLNSVGGLSEVWRIASERNRTQTFDMEPNMFKRNTFWAMQIGLLLPTISRFSASQKFVQKLLSVPKEQDARKAIWIMTFGWIITIISVTLIGLSMYAKYHDCDPLKAKLVHRSDQTLVYFVLDVAGHIPGLPGIFLAGIVSASLSTLSACFNTLSGIIYDDFIINWLPESPNQELRATIIMKTTVVIIGIISTALVLLLEELGTFIDMVFTISSVLDTPILVLFVLGMLVPWAGKKGALVGGYSSLIFAIWQVGGSQWHLMNKRIHFPHLPTETYGCPYPLNETMTTTTTTLRPDLVSDDEPFFLFRISIFYFTLTASLVGIFVGLVTSFVTKEMDLASVNPDYVSPIVRRFLPKKTYIEVPLKDMHSNCTRPANELS